MTKMDVNKSMKSALGGSRAEARVEGRARLVSMDEGHGPGKGVGEREILPKGIETRGCPRTTSAQRVGGNLLVVSN